MSEQTSCVVLRLSAPMQSWGAGSYFDYRKTEFFPTKSGISGLILAALGIPRGNRSEDPLKCEKAWLEKLNQIRLTLIKLDCIEDPGKKMAFQSTRIVDFHTVGNTKTADGKIKPTHLTKRQYLCDANFLAFLCGEEEVLGKISDALKNPRWMLFLGRKSCPPSAPVFAGKFDALQQALESLTGETSTDGFDGLIEAQTFESGTDSIADSPLDFDSANRSFRPRRVKTFRKRREIKEELPQTSKSETLQPKPT